VLRDARAVVLCDVCCTLYTMSYVLCPVSCSCILCIDLLLCCDVSHRSGDESSRRRWRQLF
jgi:hypothetical protein